MALSEPPTTFSPSDRIQQLNDIDKDVAKLLYSASSALKALTKSLPSSPTPAAAASPTSPMNSVTLESQKSAFTASMATYFSLVSSIDVRLRRQVYALEEAGIVLPESQAAARDAGVLRSFGSATTRSGRGGTGAGAGLGGAGAARLDVGWLNSRRDVVGKAMDGGLWREARDIVERLEGRGTRTADGINVHGGEDENGKEDEDKMELD